MMSNRDELYEALARLRNAKTDREANAAQTDASRIGMKAAQKVSDPKRRKEALTSLDSDIKKANRQRKTG